MTNNREIELRAGLNIGLPNGAVINTPNKQRPNINPYRFNIQIVDNLIEEYYNYIVNTKFVSMNEYGYHIYTKASIEEIQFAEHIMGCAVASNNAADIDCVIQAYKKVRKALIKKKTYMNMLRALVDIEDDTTLLASEHKVVNEFIDLIMQLVVRNKYDYNLGTKVTFDYLIKHYDHMELNILDKLLYSYYNKVKNCGYMSFNRYMEVEGKSTSHEGYSIAIEALMDCHPNSKRIENFKYIIDQYRTLRILTQDMKKFKDVIITLIRLESQPNINIADIRIIYVFESIIMYEASSGRDIDMSIEEYGSRNEFRNSVSSPVHNMIDNNRIKASKQSKSKTPAEKAAETRVSNTRKEVQFLAGAYYDCAVFVFNSGFNDMNIVNSQFENMLTTYINSGKIKKESYSRFKNILRDLGYKLPNSKEQFIGMILNEFDANGFVINRDVSKFKKDFEKLLSDSNISMPSTMRDALFLNTLWGIGEINSDKAILDQVETMANTSGLSGVKFTGPQIITYSDGCSHITWGSLFTNRDKLGKKW